MHPICSAYLSALLLLTLIILKTEPVRNNASGGRKQWLKQCGSCDWSRDMFFRKSLPQI
jgi:hypothetical protein